MDLSQLKFQVDTTELDRAGKVIGDLVTNLEKLDKASIETAKAEALLAKASRDTAKANLDNAKAEEVVATAVEKRTKAVERSSAAAKKNTDLLQLQGDTYEFILEGFSKGDAKVLAMAKATGQLSDELKKVLTDIRQFSKNTFDQTETGLDRMVKSAKEASTAQNFLNEGLRLTTKQAKELSNDLDRLNIRLQHQGASYQEIVKQQAIYKQNFIEEASAVNRATDALSNIEKQRRDTASASNYLTQADQRMAAALNQSNAALDKGSTDSLVKYESALRKSGISQELATQKLATYKTQLAQVQQLENKRREEFLARAIMPQVTDVAVSLWSGQNPLTVLLQQGGQVTDLFNQSGIAAEKFGESVKTAMKGMLPSILTVVKGVGGLLVDGFVSAGSAVSGFLAKIVGMTGAMDKMYMKMSENGPSQFGGTIRNISALLSGVFATGVFAVVASLIALGVAFKNAIKEGAELTRNLELTGASLALTKSAALDLAQSLASSERPVASVVSVINELAKAGKFSSENIALVTNAAIDLERYGKVAIADTAKELSKLREDPVKALIEVAEKTGYVNVETIETVKSLREQGKMAEAAEVAMKAWATSSSSAASSIKNQMSPLEQVWDSILSKINQVIGRLQDLARGSGLAEQIADKEAQLASVKGGFFTSTFGLSPKGAKDVGRLSEEIYMLKLQLQAETDITKERAKRSSAAAQLKAETDATKEYTTAIEKQAGKEATLTEFVRKALEERTKFVANALSKNIEDVKLSAETIDKITKGAELQWKKQRAKPDRQGIKDLETEIDLRNKELGLLGSFNNELDSIERLRAKSGDEDKYQKSLNALIEKQPIYLERQKEINAAHDLSNKLFGQADMLGKEYYKTLEQINREESSGLRSPENAEKARQAAFDQTQLAKTRLKIEQDSANLVEKYRDDIEKSLNIFTLENSKLDDRLTLLGLTSEQQKYLRIEQERRNKLLAIDLKLQTQIQEVWDKWGSGGFGQDGATKAKAVIIDLEQAAAEERKVINREVAVQAAEDYDAEFKKIKATVSESITAALFDGGKAGSSKIKDYLKAKLRERITLSIDAFINPIMGAVAGSLGFGGSGASAAASAGGALGSIGNIANAAKSAYSAFTGGFTAPGSMYYGLATSGVGQALGLSNSAAIVGNNVSAFAPAGTQLTGLGSSLGTALPYLGAAAAIYSIAKSLDDSGTLHTGGAAQYSAFGGLTSGSSGAAYDFGFGQVEAGQSTISAMETLSKSLVQIFDGIAKTFGKTAGYEVATAFADDTSKDGAWGAFKIQLGGVEILNWDDFRQSRWAPKEFGDGQEGYQQYLSAIAKDTRKVLLDMDLPSWANKILSDLGESASIENLTSAIAQIGNIRTVFENLKSTFTQLSSVGDSALESLMNLSGGIDSLANAASSYYNNFYSDVEKANKLQSDLTKSLAEYNLALPTTKEAYRALVEAQNVSTEAGARAYVALLQNSSMFAELIAMQAELANAEKDTTEEVSNSVKALSNSVIEEINRLRGYTENSSSPQNLISEFNRLTTLARGGDANAFNSLGNQAGLLDDYYKNTSVSAAEYAFQRAILANSLEQSYNTVKSSGGVFDGSVSIMGTPSLVSPSVSTIPASSNDNSSLIKSLINEVALVRIAIEADVIQNAKTAKILERVTPEGDALATRTEG